MKASMIAQKIRQKMSAWIRSIEEHDKNLANEVSNCCFVAGGCIPALYRGEEVNDYDVYLSEIQVLWRLAKHYAAQWASHRHGATKLLGQQVQVRFLKACAAPEYTEASQMDSTKGESIKFDMRAFAEMVPEDRVVMFIKSSGIQVAAPELDDDQRARLLHRDNTGDSVDPNTDDAGPMEPYRYFEGFPPEYCEDFFADIKTRGQSSKWEKRKFRPKVITENAIALSDGVQLILRFSGKSEWDTVKEFDYEHCKGWWSFENGLNTRASVLECILGDELRFTGTKYPLCAMFRLRKFLNRGYWITAGQMLKVGFAISELNLKNLVTLREQLVGVDIHYFYQLLQLIQAQKEEAERSGKEARALDGSYLSELIDQVWG